MRWSRRLAACLIVPLIGVAIACGKDLVDSDSSSQGDGGSDGGSSCVCLPAVPDGWIGPLVVDELADCAAPWSVEEGRAFADVDAGEHACTCTCDPKPVGCSVHFDVAGNPACASGLCGGYVALNEDFCLPKGGSCNQVVRYVVDGGGCAAGQITRIDPPSFGRTARRCTTPEPIRMGACGPNEPCAPQHPPTGAHCIYRAGSSLCPPSYRRASTYYQTLEDTRECTPCQCGEDAGACDVALHTQPGCTDMPPLKLTKETCISMTNFSNVRLRRKASLCAASGGDKKGSVTEANAVTVCCAEP